MAGQAFEILSKKESREMYDLSLQQQERKIYLMHRFLARGERSMAGTTLGQVCRESQQLRCARHGHLALLCYVT